MIDLSRFNLTTPELKPDTTDEAMSYSPGEFPANQYFFATEKGFTVHAPTKALGTTDNSDRSRCELRETTPEGKAVNFKMDQYDHNFLQAALTVMQSPKHGRTTVGQIHVKNSTRPMLKLFHDGDKVIASFRKVFSQKNPVNYTMMEGVDVGDRFTYSIHVSKGGTLSIVISVDGEKENLVLDIDESWRGRELYFKAGTYIQEDADENTAEDEGSTIFFDKLVIRHE